MCTSPIVASTWARGDVTRSPSSHLLGLYNRPRGQVTKAFFAEKLQHGLRRRQELLVESSHGVPLPHHRQTSDIKDDETAAGDGTGFMRGARQTACCPTGDADLMNITRSASKTETTSSRFSAPPLGVCAPGMPCGIGFRCNDHSFFVASAQPKNSSSDKL